jgi:hypothetical protein
MPIDRRQFLQDSAVTATGMLFLSSCNNIGKAGNPYRVDKALSVEMYNKALSIAKNKIRGGEKDPVYKKPFVDAAFSSNIFYWDTCFIATYAKYHQEELPIGNALDNFYALMEPDGFICREYTKEGKPMWPRDHPVSVNPPLLAFAELELYAVSKDLQRLAAVYPKLKKHFEHWTQTWRGEDKLFFNDALGSGMDNIERYPREWQDDKKGIPIHNLHPELFNYDGLTPAWNKQGRMVDTTAQYALFTRQLSIIADLVGRSEDKSNYDRLYSETKEALNNLCWNEEDAFYYDLGYSKQIRRKHIGMFWTLMAGIVPKEKLSRFLAHLTNPNEFWRKIPVATTSADEPEYSAKGDYWRGSIWAPTNYMVLRGLSQYGEHKLARKLAGEYYWAVAEVYKKTKTFWENYAPDTIDKGNIAREDFCGWTGLVPIAVYREFISKNGGRP